MKINYFKQNQNKYHTSLRAALHTRVA